MIKHLTMLVCFIWAVNTSSIVIECDYCIESTHEPIMIQKHMTVMWACTTSLEPIYKAAQMMKIPDYDVRVMCVDTDTYMSVLWDCKASQAPIAAAASLMVISHIDINCLQSTSGWIQTLQAAHTYFLVLQSGQIYFI